MRLKYERGGKPIKVNLGVAFSKRQLPNIQVEAKTRKILGSSHFKEMEEQEL